jgi:putative inorganic carbon (hco3(-)) transporter
MSSSTQTRPAEGPAPHGDARPHHRGSPVVRFLTVVIGVALGMLVAFVPPAGIAIAVLLGLLVLMQRWRDSIPVLTIALIYSNAVVILAQRGTVPTSAGALLLGALAFTVLRDVVQTRSRPVGPPGLPLVLLFGGVQCVSSLLSVAPALSQSEVISSLTQGILLFVLVGYAVVRTRTLMSIVNALLVVGAVLGTLSVIQHLTGDYTNTFYGFAGVSNAVVPGGVSPTGVTQQPRLNGNIGETNRYGQVLAVLLPLAAARIAIARSVLLRLLTVVAAAAIGGGIVFTYSRGTAVAVVATLVTLVVMRWVRLRWLVSGVALVLVVALSTPGYAERLSSVTSILGATQQAGSSKAADNAVRGRTTEVFSALLAFADHPVLGVGPGAFPVVYPQYAAQVGIRPRLEEREAHNLYAGIAAETGVLGLIPFLLLLWRLLTGLARAAREWAPVNRSRALLARGFFASVLIYAYSGMFLHLSNVRYFWLLMGLSAACARLPGVPRRPVAWGRRRRREDQQRAEAEAAGV